jgi:hypothetical protein
VYLKRSIPSHKVGGTIGIASSVHEPALSGLYAAIGTALALRQRRRR